MSEDERINDDGRSEAQIRMEQEMKRRKEKAAEEMAEYEEMRREQREREAEEIQELRQRRETRKKERAEEEKRLAELRAQEELKRRTEDEERQRKKKEEESRRREEREAKRKEHEDRVKKSGPNFTISKKSSEGVGGNVADEGVEKKPTKSKEQLEAERRAELERRFHKVDTSGMSTEALKEKAKELHHILYKLESEKYDLMKRFEQQSYDMQELAERARQMSKGGGKKNVNVSATHDPLAAKFSGVPPKVTMYSQYERVKDHRSFHERSDVFKGPLYAEEFERIEPAHKVVMTETGAKYADGSGGDAHHSANSHE